MFQVKTKLIDNKKVRANYRLLAMEAAQIARQAIPGQFVTIKINDIYEPLLRRPFSIHQINKNTVGILYEVLGKGTEILSRKKRGKYLDIIGPLGKGFDCRAANNNYHLPILVAGGMGVAPLLFLAERFNQRNLQVFLGAKTKNQILCEKEFKNLGYDVKIATDDGSQGFKGKVTELLKNILPLAISDKRVAIYACGPRPMLKEISRIAKQYKIPAQISLEEHMACGIGACLGCAVNTQEGYQRVCKDGPVFAAEEIIWG